jgi:methylase of polypeptide subunit release factors
MHIFSTDETDGGGSKSIEDVVSATLTLLGNQPVTSVMEWCSGPGFWGFGLLRANIGIRNLLLVDKHAPVGSDIAKTIQFNSVTGVKFCCSDTFDNVPKQQFDLIVGNPPHFCVDPFNKHYTDPRRYKDPEWQIHRKFFNTVSDYLTDNGRIILLENIWGSGPQQFTEMLSENNLRINRAMSSEKFENELWYAEIVKIQR